MHQSLTGVAYIRWAVSCKFTVYTQNFFGVDLRPLSHKANMPRSSMRVVGT